MLLDKSGGNVFVRLILVFVIGIIIAGALDIGFIDKMWLQMLQLSVVLGFLMFLGSIPLRSLVGSIRMAWTIRSAKVTAITMAKNGFVKVKGKIVPMARLTSPLTKTNCVYYRYMVADVGDKKGDKSFGDGTKFVPFEINDGTGSVKVDAKKAWVYAKPLVEFEEGKTKTPRPPIAVKFLRGRTAHCLIAEEFVLKPGTVVSVAGVLKNGMLKKRHGAELYVWQGYDNEVAKYLLSGIWGRAFLSFLFFVLPLAVLVGYFWIVFVG